MVDTTSTPSINRDRALTQLAKVGLMSLLLPLNSYAGFFSSKEQDSIDEISKYQKPISELLDQLRPTMVPNAVGVFSVQQILRGGKEDSDVVLTYLSTYISPLQKKMSEGGS